MAFKGWPAAAIEFFDGLEFDNSKTYWQANKATNESAVKAPMVELLAELEPEFGESKIFRPNRDIRFSADKSPYKTSIAARLGDRGYLQLSSAGLATGTGMYFMAADQLDRFRKAIDADRTGKELESLVADARKKSIEVTAHEALKTAPKGYSKDHPRIELLRLKGLVTWREWPVAPWLSTRKAKDRVVGLLHDAVPLQKWLDHNVGPSDLPDPFSR